MYYVIGNIYRGEGFTWIVEELDHKHNWKYSQHGSYETESEAIEMRTRLNQVYFNIKIQD